MLKWYQHLAKINENSLKNRGRKKDGPKSIKIEPCNAQMWIFRLPRVFPDAYRGLPGFTGVLTGVFGEGSKPLPGGVREGNSEDL